MQVVIIKTRIHAAIKAMRDLRTFTFVQQCNIERSVRWYVSIVSYCIVLSHEVVC